MNLLRKEANLPKKCVVNTSQIFTVDKSDLQEKIGSLSKLRIDIDKVLMGVHLVIDPKEVD